MCGVIGSYILLQSFFSQSFASCHIYLSRSTNSKYFPKCEICHPRHSREVKHWHSIFSESLDRTADLCFCCSISISHSPAVVLVDSARNSVRVPYIKAAFKPQEDVRKSRMMRIWITRIKKLDRTAGLLFYFRQ